MEQPIVMGILNVTPDSFFDGGSYIEEKAILTKAEKMLAEGASIIDVGGYSTRPGAKEISIQEELQRVTMAIKSIVKQFPNAIVSIDTFRSNVAKAAYDEGATMVNDVSGGELDPGMFGIVGSMNVPYVLMHMRGTPQTMSNLTAYDDLELEMRQYFLEKLGKLRESGVKDIVIDPGFGFAKTREQNFHLLNRLEQFCIFGCPVLAGLSRKSLIWKTLGQRPEDALNGTTVLNTVSVMKGASILRVHDVKEAMETVRLMTALSAGTAEGK